MTRASSGQAPRTNPGPAAAPRNRQRLLVAARELFATQGYRVPLSAIAQQAGVGQGVLYRHFPTRLSLAIAAFEENLDALEELAADTSTDDAFLVLWRHALTTLLESTAFVELVADADGADAARGAAERMAAVFSGPLERAQRAGLVRDDLTVSDLFLLARMVHGLAATVSPGESLPDAVRRALNLIDPALSSLPA